MHTASIHGYIFPCPLAAARRRHPFRPLHNARTLPRRLLQGPPQKRPGSCIPFWRKPVKKSCRFLSFHQKKGSIGTAWKQPIFEIACAKKEYSCPGAFAAALAGDGAAGCGHYEGTERRPAPGRSQRIQKGLSVNGRCARLSHPSCHCAG